MRNWKIAVVAASVLVVLLGGCGGSGSEDACRERIREEWTTGRMTPGELKECKGLDAATVSRLTDEAVPELNDPIDVDEWED